MAFVVATLITACTGGSGASTSPTIPPSPTIQPSPTPAPTPTPSPTFGPDQIAHPTGATDVVLRLEQGGGFVPMNFLVTQAPAFTLYGDGTVIFKPIDTRENNPIGGQAELPWLVGHLDEESVQALLLYALDTGRLANAKDVYNNAGCADCSTTLFTVNAAGLSKNVSVYALSEVNDPGPEQADRQGFSKLAAVLNNIQGQVGVDLGEVTAYDAALYKVILVDGFGQPPLQPMAWPWDDLTLASWPAAGDEPGRIKMLDREHVAKLLDVPNGGHIGVWVTAPDGTVVQFGVRPLLPDEIAAFNAS
jgi:hypothetical protein